MHVGDTYSSEENVFRYKNNMFDMLSSERVWNCG